LERAREWSKDSSREQLLAREELLLASVRVRAGAFALVAVVAWLMSFVVIGFVERRSPQMQEGSMRALERQWVIDLNEATAEDLQLIPSLGPNLIRAILSKRRELGKYESLEQLATIPGIKAGRIKVLSRYLSVSRAGAVSSQREPLE